MADLRPGGARDRAQLLLVGALSLAVVLVVLALLLNSAIFTQSVATRGSGLAGGSDVAAHRDIVEDAVGETVEFANANETGYADQTRRVTDELPRVEETLAASHARNGRSVTLSFVDQTNGTRVARTSDGALEAYTITDVDGVRGFRLDVNRSTLTNDTASTDPNPPPPASIGSLTGTLRITFVGPSDDWEIAVYRDDEGGQTVVAVYENGNRVGWCTDASGSRTVVDVTAAQVGGEHCMALEFFDDLGTPFDVEFVNGVGTEGTYEYVVAQDETSVDNDIDLTATPPPPTTEQVLFSVTVTTEYRTPELAFEGNTTVVPEGLR